MGTLTLGSLFDGSGGFPLGGILAGIKPVWQSEIEPFPIRVTTKRLPFVKHYGDVNTLDGGELEPVDIITFGSPCTDLSIAGKRAGLEGSQSGLFHQAIRIIKEMREKTNGIYPRFIVWENVPGAFSSHGGDDFQKVLEEICGICGGSVSVPGSAKWEPAGCILGDGFSVAWRVLDADAWGVPQRRKRIYLVGHLTGHCAGKILFESEGVSGYSAEGFRSWQRTACHTEGGAGEAGGGICLNDQGGNRMDVTHETTATLRAEAHHPPLVLHQDAFGICSKDSNSMKSDNPKSGFYGANTSRTLDANGGNPSCNQGGIAVVETVKTFDVRQSSDGTVNMRNHAYESNTSRCVDRGGNMPGSNHGGIAVVSIQGSPEKVTYCSTKASFFTSAAKEKVGSLVATDYKDPPLINFKYAVRRLTPTECARLQGFPDWWCAGLETPEPTEEEIRFWMEVFETHRKVMGTAKKSRTRNQVIKWLKNPHTDSAEYKMWGNGVALPCVFFVLSGIMYYADK